MTKEVWDFELGERWDFDLGDRVQMWSKSAGEWKVGIIRSWLLTPYQRSLKPRYYGVIFDGTASPRHCRAKDLRPLNRASTAAREGDSLPSDANRCDDTKRTASRHPRGEADE